jgi:hypothetical protein
MIAPCFSIKRLSHFVTPIDERVSPKSGIGRSFEKLITATLAEIGIEWVPSPKEKASWLMEFPHEQRKPMPFSTDGAEE